LESKFNAATNVLQNLTVNGFEFRVVFLPPRKRRDLRVEGRGFHSLLAKCRSLMYHAVVDKSADSEGFI